jgi:predicted lipoprotein with Yx(FWY)xxD motif
MPRLRTATIGLAAAALATSGMTAVASASAGHAAPGSSGTTVKTRSTDLGTFLTDSKGHTLYLFEKDAGKNKSRCYRHCAKAWPPLLTSGSPHAAGKVKASKLGTTKRKDGTTQVTYNGDPLYYYAADSGKTTRGEGLEEFGAEWYVINPHGKKIDDDE